MGHRGTRDEKVFFKNVDFRPNRLCKPNPYYRLSVPGLPWDSLGHKRVMRI